MNQRPPICGKCGAVVIEGGSVASISSALAAPESEAFLCDDCTGRLFEFLGPRALRPAGPRKAVVDPERFQQREEKARWLAEAKRRSDEVERRLQAGRDAEKARAAAEHREKVARAEAAGIGGWDRR